MNIVCPTVLAANVEDFYDQLATVSPFAERIQIDLGDGVFTTRSVGLKEIECPDEIDVDIHLMYQDPHEALPRLIALQPSMVILHAEADNIASTLQHLREHGIRTGLALLQATEVKAVSELVKQVDHVLIFSGSLGSFGGKADLSLLRKVADIRAVKRSIEIGWDGGVNASNIKQLAAGGINVLNVGGAIQKATRPVNAYRELRRILQD